MRKAEDDFWVENNVINSDPDFSSDTDAEDDGSSKEGTLKDQDSGSDTVEESDEEEDPEKDPDMNEGGRPRPQRERRPPIWHSDYVFTISEEADSSPSVSCVMASNGKGRSGMLFPGQNLLATALLCLGECGAADPTWKTCLGVYVEEIQEAGLYLLSLPLPT